MEPRSGLIFFSVAMGTSSKPRARLEHGLDSGWPSAPPPATSADADDEIQVSIADTFERLLGVDDFYLELESLDQELTVAPGTSGLHPTDLAEVRALFAQLAANHVRQVRDFMIELRMGEARA